MLSPLKPLLCKHDFYWSERHGSDRCRRCGKRQTAEPVLAAAHSGLGLAAGGLGSAPLSLGASSELRPTSGSIIDFEEPRARLAVRTPETIRPSAKVLKAQAQERRAGLLDLLDRLAEGDRPTREETLDVVLAVIEDAHSANPVLFGPDAAGHFARLHDARSAPRC
ncbi:hypothetical protein [Brevundimonas sp.]|uniref:hypothetical protein n=1 Tax=Brevundimonas sp. TaxID=1871086 RepID=UPI002D640A69|nr:hypothetical protein [Brevundimonas sp.]HYC69099.1 hypothetical protein [Brevundimonas sp.]